MAAEEIEQIRQALERYGPYPSLALCALSLLPLDCSAPLPLNLFASQLLRLSTSLPLNCSTLLSLF